MPLTVALQMDPLDAIDIYDDDTFLIAMEAQKRGYLLYYYHPNDLCLEDGVVSAFAYPVTSLRKEVGNHCTFGEPRIIDLAKDVDVVLMRQDPPFDMAYITATHILDHIKDVTFVTNDPAGVRNAPEKLLVTHFTELAPPTLITSSRDALRRFYDTHKNIVLKPLYGAGGAQVYHIDESRRNFNTVLEMFEMFFKEPIIAQKFIPEVTQGDKRIFLFDGEIAGAYLRIPAEGESRANTHAGGSTTRTTLSKRDKEICAAIGPTLKERGLLFTGIDVLGHYLTEINVTSPGGMRDVNRLENVCLESDLWDVFEEKLKAREVL